MVPILVILFMIWDIKLVGEIINLRLLDIFESNSNFFFLLTDTKLSFLQWFMKKPFDESNRPGPENAKKQMRTNLSWHHI